MRKILCGQNEGDGLIFAQPNFIGREFELGCLDEDASRCCYRHRIDVAPASAQNWNRCLSLFPIGDYPGLTGNQQCEATILPDDYLR